PGCSVARARADPSFARRGYATFSHLISVVLSNKTPAKGADAIIARVRAVCVADADSDGACWIAGPFYAIMKDGKAEIVGDLCPGLNSISICGAPDTTSLPFPTFPINVFEHRSSPGL